MFAPGCVNARQTEVHPLVALLSVALRESLFRDEVDGLNHFGTEKEMVSHEESQRAIRQVCLSECTRCPQGSRREMWWQQETSQSRFLRSGMRTCKRTSPGRSLVRNTARGEDQCCQAGARLERRLSGKFVAHKAVRPECSPGRSQLRAKMGTVTPKFGFEMPEFGMVKGSPGSRQQTCEAGVRVGKPEFGLKSRSLAG